MGLLTQEMEKDENGESIRNGNNDGNLRLDTSGDTNGRKPVGYLQVKKWSVMSEKIMGSEEDLRTIYPIYAGANCIGRSSDSFIRFPFSVISARHACIDVKETLHTIQDYGSTNETKRNGVALEPDVRYEIVNGTELSFADIECAYFVGRLPKDIRGREQKLQEPMPNDSSPLLEQDSMHSSNAGSTTAFTTMLRNFLTDSDSEDILGDPKSSGENSKATTVSNLSPLAKRKKDGAPTLTVLVEESQYIADERPGSSSLFHSDIKDPQIVRETEHFLADGSVEVDNETESNGGGNNMDKAPDDSIGTLHLAGEEHVQNPASGQAQATAHDTDDVRQDNAAENEERMPISVSDKKVQKDALETTGEDRSSIEEAIRPQLETPISIGNDEAMAETMPYLGGLPVPLHSLKVPNRLHAVLATPASSTTGTTRSAQSSAAKEKIEENRTSVWSTASGNDASRRSAKKRSLLDVAVESWLFKSEPDTRRRKHQAEKTRRKTVGEKPRSRLEELTDKCSKAAIASRRVSKEKKALEDSINGEIVKLAALAESKVKDPFEFGPSQLTPKDGAGGSFLNSVDVSTKKMSDATEKRKQTARKSIGPSRTEDKTAEELGESTAAISVAAAAPKLVVLKRKRGNDESLFDEAAERSRQQQCPPKQPHTASARDPESGTVDEPDAESRPRAQTEAPPCKKAKTEASVLESSGGEEDNPAPPADRVDLEDEEQRDEPDGSTKPKRKPKAPPKTQATTGAKLPQNAEKVKKSSREKPMDEFSDILVPKKVAAKKPSGRGQEKACDKSTESKGKRIVKKEPEETIRVCFTQMSHLSKPELEMMKQDVKDLNGEVVDSGVDCTHLVVPKFARSAKLMCAVARGAAIVVPEWVDASKLAGRFVVDKAEEKRLGFSLRRCLADARERIDKEGKRLFDGYTFYSTESVRPNREEMKAIVTAAGGRFLDRLPKSSPKGTIFVALSCEADAESADTKRLKTMEVPIVTMEFVFSGLLKREANSEKYALFDDQEPPTEPLKGRKRTQQESGSSQASSAQQDKGKRGKSKK